MTTLFLLTLLAAGMPQPLTLQPPMAAVLPDRPRLVRKRKGKPSNRKARRAAAAQRRKR